MTTDPAGVTPDPQRNREAWLAAHPGAAPVDPGAATQQVAAQLGAGAPGAGVPAETLGEQMAGQGATAGVQPQDGSLPYEDLVDQMLSELRDLRGQVEVMQEQRRQERAAAIAALGEPIVQRYANGVRDKLAAHLAANPGLGPDHFGRVLSAADQLSKAAADAISRGANDMGQVRSLAGVVDRWLTRTHPRTAPSHLGHVDFSSVAYDLELLLEEADRLAPANGVALVGA